MKETPSCDHLESMTDKSQFCTMIKQKETIWKVAFPNSTAAERLSWVLLRQSETIINGFMTYLENNVKELKDATIDTLVDFMNTRAETREKSFGAKVCEFWGFKKNKGESTMDFGTKLQLMARRIDSVIWEKLVVQKLLIEADDYTRFLINSTIDETTKLAEVLKKILDAEEVTHGRDFKKEDSRKKDFKLTCWFCKETDHKKEECKKWKDAGSPAYNFTTKVWETSQLKICNNDLAAMRDIVICGQHQRVFLDSGSTENWISLEKAKILGVDLLPTNGIHACMADGSVLKAIAMCDCDVDFRDGKGIQTLRFYISSKGRDTIIGWKFLKDKCELFEERSDSESSMESSLTTEYLEEDLRETVKEEHNEELINKRMEILNFMENLEFKATKERKTVSLELREGVSKGSIVLKKDYRRRVKDIFKHGLKAYLEKEEELGMITRVYDMPRILSPIHIVKKKNADEHMENGNVPCDFMRVCVDYSELNQFLLKKEVELIKLENVIDMISGSEVLSTMDVSAAYKALPLDEVSKDLTCFYTPYGIYRAETLPFGLSTAPALFVTELREALKEVHCNNYTFYMDDFLFYGPIDKQMEAIKEVSLVLARRGWTWNSEKSTILERQVNFIGYQISGTEWKIPEEKLRKLLELKPPKNARELASLRGKLLYFSRLIPEYGTITSVWDGGTFQWGEKEQEAFDTIMRILKESPKITTIPKEARLVIVVNESQGKSISSALYWYTDKSHGVACWNSRKATATERNYSKLDRWVVAIYEMMNQTRLKHRKVYIQCNNMEQSKRIRSSYEEEMLGYPKSKRVRGMLFTLSLMDLEPINLPEVEQTISKFGLGMLAKDEEEGLRKRENEEIGHLKLTTMENNIIMEARKDAMYMNMFKGLFEGDYKFLQKHQMSLTGERNVLTLDGKLIVPTSVRKEIVAKIHKDYHEGTKNLTNRIHANYIIHGLTRLVKDVIEECKLCQMFKRNGECKTLIWIKACEPRERGHMDFFFQSGKTIFLLVDAYSNYPFARVIKRKTDYFEVLKEVMALFGDFQLLVSDNEPVFQMNEIAEWLEERGILHFFVPTYSPKSNGLAEGMVNILKTKMKKAQEELRLGVEESLTWALISVRTSLDEEGKSRLEKFVGQRSSQRKWFQEVHFDDSKMPVYFKISPNHTWMEGQLIWTIGTRIKGVLAEGTMHMLPAERVRERKEGEETDTLALEEEKIIQCDEEIMKFLEKEEFKYPAGIFFTDGSTKNENGYGVVGLIYHEEGKIEIQVEQQRDVKHGSAGPSANRLEIMAVKAALERAKELKLSQSFIFSDSRNLTGAYNEGWILNWRDNGFSRISNSSLYKAVDNLMQEVPEVHIRRVLAHKGIVLNECADELAKGGDPDVVTAKVKQWLTTQLEGNPK